MASLRKLDERGFAGLLHARRVNARGIEDLLDLAEWLDAPVNIAAALRRLDWPTLRGLRLGEQDALVKATALALAVGEAPNTELLPEASRALREILPEVTDFSELTTVSAESAGTTAAHATAQLANDALWLIAAEPRIVRRSREQVRLSGVDVRRLATELVSDSGVVGSLYRWLFAANLITPVGEVWHLTEAGEQYCTKPVTERWRILIAAWLDELHIDNLRALSESIELDAALPTDVSPFDQIAEDDTDAIVLSDNATVQRSNAEALGVLDRGSLTRLGGLVLDTDVTDAVRMLGDHLPQEVAQVYVQPDQTILAPGPLSGALDHELRRIADLERRALASEYRLTPASIGRALSDGMSAESIREFLAGVSLTGIPQPVDYLVNNTAQQHGRVRVREYDRSVGQSTRIRATDKKLLDALQVDTALGTLGLRRIEDELASRVSPQVALAALLDARYPAVLETADGSTQVRHRREPAAPYVPEPNATAAKAAADLAEQAAAGDHADDQSTWIQRRLELARRNKHEVRVAIDIPGKPPAVLALIPLSVGAQRLRARDLDADVERTLPLRSIIGIEEA
ncbi:MAG: helicase-associated domain-containing protein [Gulosibacter sp.]|uniref:helicase-associated domain-containing protein n=1 Tax=Gulosibacter sp. TaxID=2817531 RepID=UPI003F8FDC2A